MIDLVISLDSTSARPLYEQIYDFIKTEIQNGGLPVAERLPSSRILAKQLEVSRSTVTLAYEQLVSEGYIENRPHRGYFINDLAGLYRLDPVKQRRKLRPDEAKAEEYRYDFSPAGVDLKSFPYNIWRKLTKELLAADSQELFRLSEPQGERELRETMALYLHHARGVRCTAEQIIIGAGNDYLMMLLQLILGDTRICAMERLTYRKAADILKLLGNEVISVEMDEYGLRTDALKHSGASLIYVMPSHQFPLGTVMPVKRRAELLAWAADGADRFIIEDDYDSEFRYKGRPIPALQGYDTLDRVIYIGTFSKSIAPSIRISFMVLPLSLMERYCSVGARFSTTVSRLDQKLLTEFIRGGYYERHLNRMRGIYKGRHDILMDELKKLRHLVEVSGEHAGTHVLLHMKNGMTEREAVESAKNAGIRVYELSSYGLEKTKEMHTILLGYANLSEKEIPQAVRSLAGCWDTYQTKTS
ncbi:MAG: PLP-dependent aminotransferase family protein [Eubacteriales bacterium]|nr:PLP-dependent aminotransferase family protein [Eubacteriales bacterium]